MFAQRRKKWAVIAKILAINNIQYPRDAEEIFTGVFISLLLY